MTQPTTQTVSNPKQVSFTASYVCMTKYDSAMFRIIEIPDKYQTNHFLNQKLREYEEAQYIYINMKKLTGVSLDTSRKLKVYILFEDFTDKKGQYVLYFKAVLIKDKGLLDTRQFNDDIMDSDDD